MQLRTKVTFGNPVSGLLIDHVPETAFVGGTLTIDDSGIRLEVPYPQDAAPDQFGAVKAWFHDQHGPSALTIVAPGVSATLFECTYGPSGYTFGGNGILGGKVSARSCVLSEYYGDVPTGGLAVTALTSRLDGLKAWTGLRSTEMTILKAQRPDHGPRLRIEAETNLGFDWQISSIRMSASTSWLVPGAGEPVQVIDECVLKSESDATQGISEHLDEHRKVKDLLSVVYGRRAFFRGHQVRSTDLWPPEGTDEPGAEGRIPMVEAFVLDTLGDEAQDPPNARDFSYPLVRFADVGPEGIAAWMRSYQGLHRVIQPVVSLSEKKVHVEDIVVSSAMAIEAAGKLIGEVPGEEPTLNKRTPMDKGTETFTTYCFRVLSVAKLDTERVAESRHAAARAVGKLYRDIKHPERGAFPLPLHSYLGGRLALLAVRTYLISTIDDHESLVDRVGSTDLDNLSRDFEANALRIDSRGRFVPISAVAS